MGAEAAVSVMMAKTKLGGLVRHQRVEATGVDLTAQTEEGCASQAAFFMSESSCVCTYEATPRVFRAGSASRG